MIKLNSHYQKLQSGYLFVEIARRVAAHIERGAGRELIKLGIGDVTRPLSPAIIQAFHDGVNEQAEAKTFHGYGPEQGYAFLREAIAEYDFKRRGCPISADEIFISDGAKCDTGNIQELFAADVRVAVPDPVYPVYVDTNVMAGRSGAWKDGRYSALIYLEGRPENSFAPGPETLGAESADLVYLCFPNNPTGAIASRELLSRWVEWALKNKALLLFDAAYEAFISSEEIPRSIYEIPGADTCAVEFRSFSKTAGFTGTRCAFTVVPKAISIGGASLHSLWNRRHATKTNGVCYPVQKAAAAVYSPQGQRETKESISYYMANARLIRKAMQEAGFQVWGGKHSPYVWIKTGEDSWSTFDTLLQKADVVVTPGSGFGRMGEGFIRISAFNNRDKVEEALERIQKIFSA
ncbi:MAG: LL-diaminopimelate aminotransferase [Spirochaeta sp. LUC14_002_19_P3]|nr:MAG: LL-diaminopimelate aminotransferase [Spirochaeta sp. LUC14_002_19_P3]